MSKQEFLEQLRKGLSGLPQEDIEERVSFFNEMIEDRMDEGLTEEEAVMAAGSVEEIIEQTVADIPFAKIAKERIKPKRQLKTWEIVLLIAGSPIWFSLAIALIAIVFAVYVSLWSVIISLWAVFTSFIACSFGCLAGSIIIALTGNPLVATIILSIFFILVGLSIFMLYGCIATTKGIIQLTKKFALWIKGCFIKKEEV